MFIKDIYLYSNIQSWIDEEPDAVIKGTVSTRNGNYIEIIDESDLHQIINLDRLFAVVY